MRSLLNGNDENSVLLVYSAHDDRTERVAREMNRAKTFDVDPVRELHHGGGWLDRLKSTYRARIKRSVPIQPQRDPAHYELVIVGTPVHKRTMDPCVRAYLHEHANKLRAVALFCTMAKGGAWETLREMAQICGREPISIFYASHAELEAARHRQDLEAFLDAIQRAVAPPVPVFTRAA